MVSREGWVKILDFGLAKLTEARSQELSSAATASGTVPGMVMGTVGYMSPEQAVGKPVDFRSDQFSLGTMLYELATGRRAFQRATSAETIVAVMREEPEPIAKLNPRVPAPLRWIIDRCLAKDPEQRYASTRDLARDLASLRDRLVGAVGRDRGRSRRAGRPRIPTFQRLSFRRGTILSARFAPDGRTVIYGAAWEGDPCRLFTTRPESPESSPLMLPDAEILSISRTGQLAISLERHWAGRFVWSGTLAQVPLAGGAPRELLEDVHWADWGPDGAHLAVVRSVAGKTRLEYPIGKVLYETGGWVSHPRVSPKGDLVAFLDHPALGDDEGSVVVVDRAGKSTVLSKDWITRVRTRVVRRREGDLVHGDARRRRALGLGRLARREGATPRPDARRAHDPGRDRRRPHPHDERQRKGRHHRPAARARTATATSRFSTGRSCGTSRPTASCSSSTRRARGAGRGTPLYMRNTDGSPAVQLGSGWARQLLAGRALGRVARCMRPEGREITLLPVKAGEPRSLPQQTTSRSTARGGCPTASASSSRRTRRGRASASSSRGSTASRRGRSRRPGIALGFFPVSPDGRIVVGQGPDRLFYGYPIEGGDPEFIPGLVAEDRPIRFSPGRQGPVRVPPRRAARARHPPRSRDRREDDLARADAGGPGGRRRGRVGRAHARRRVVRVQLPPHPVRPLSRGGNPMKTASLSPPSLRPLSPSSGPHAEHAKEAAPSPPPRPRRATRRSARRGPGEGRAREVAAPRRVGGRRAARRRQARHVGRLPGEEGEGRDRDRHPRDLRPHGLGARRRGPAREGRASSRSRRTSSRAWGRTAAARIPSARTRRRSSAT